VRLYNSLKKAKEDLKTLNPHKVNMYVCGPTTYNYIHLGNARPIVVFDTVRRYLEYKGYEVNYVQNFTDVDDKIIKRAQEENEKPLLLAEKYIDEYFKDADALDIKRANYYPRVSQHIGEIINAVETLINKNFAYEIGGDVFFRVRSFPAYGKLSGRTLEDILAGARVDIDERKEDPVDFALWKAAKQGEPFWESPWGKGRPGWHIECSVMAMKYLGTTIDIHGGGSDLIFPHHENEIAQSEALSGQMFVKYWMHNGFITVNNEKMSKSLGNFFILRDILNKYPADVVRFYLVSTHYRSPLDFDDGKLNEAKKALERLKNTLLLAREFIKSSVSRNGLDNHEQNLLDIVKSYEKQFVEAMDDDFNTAKAIGYLFEMSHAINIYIAKEADNKNTNNQEVISQAIRIFKSLGDILGIFIEREHYEENISTKVLNIILELRNKAREKKDYILADDIRDFLKSYHIGIEDKTEASRLKYETVPELDVLIQKLLELRAGCKKDREFILADWIRENLRSQGIIIEDTREGARWKLVNA